MDKGLIRVGYGFEKGLRMVPSKNDVCEPKTCSQLSALNVLGFLLPGEFNQSSINDKQTNFCCCAGLGKIENLHILMFDPAPQRDTIAY